MKLNNLAKQLQSENARMLTVKNEVHNAARKVAELSGHKASTFALSGVEEVCCIELCLFCLHVVALKEIPQDKVQKMKAALHAAAIIKV